MSFVARDCIGFPEDPGVMVKSKHKHWLTCCNQGDIQPVGPNMVYPGDNAVASRVEGFNSNYLANKSMSDGFLDLLMLILVGFILYKMFANK